MADPENTTVDNWLAIHKVNALGPFLGCKHAIPAMRENGSGSIVNISSAGALIPSPMNTPYGSAKAGLTKEDIDLFIPHQANKRIIDSAARQAKLPMEKVFVNIHEYGNTSAASIPIALCEALEGGRAGPGNVLAFVAFGAGLTWAAAVVKLGTQVWRA